MNYAKKLTDVEIRVATREPTGEPTEASDVLANCNQQLRLMVYYHYNEEFHNPTPGRLKILKTILVKWTKFYRNYKARDFWYSKTNSVTSAEYNKNGLITTERNCYKEDIDFEDNLKTLLKLNDTNSTSNSREVYNCLKDDKKSQGDESSPFFPYGECSYISSPPCYLVNYYFQTCDHQERRHQVCIYFSNINTKDAIKDTCDATSTEQSSISIDGLLPPEHLPGHLETVPISVGGLRSADNHIEDLKEVYKWKDPSHAYDYDSNAIIEEKLKRGHSIEEVKKFITQNSNFVNDLGSTEDLVKPFAEYFPALFNFRDYLQRENFNIDDDTISGMRVLLQIFNVHPLDNEDVVRQFNEHYPGLFNFRDYLKRENFNIDEYDMISPNGIYSEIQDYRYKIKAGYGLAPIASLQYMENDLDKSSDACKPSSCCVGNSCNDLDICVEDNILFKGYNQGKSGSDLIKRWRIFSYGEYYPGVISDQTTAPKYKVDSLSEHIYSTYLSNLTSCMRTSPNNRIVNKDRVSHVNNISASSYNYFGLFLNSSDKDPDQTIFSYLSVDGFDDINIGKIISRGNYAIARLFHIIDIYGNESYVRLVTPFGVGARSSYAADFRQNIHMFTNTGPSIE